VKQPVALLLIVVLIGTLLLVFAVAAFVGANLYIACAFLLALPATAALATFRSSVTPLAVALALSVPVALLTALFATSTPGTGTALAWSAFWLSYSWSRCSRVTLAAIAGALSRPSAPMPNPSLHPKCNSWLRQLSPSGELKR